MSYQDLLRTEIHVKLDALASNGDPWIAKWIANEICNAHSDGLAQNEHADFWRHCGYGDCRDEVRRCINKRAGDRPEAGDKQITLEGWEHIQAYYIVKRDGDDIGVSVHQLTDSEIKAKATLYRVQSAALSTHAAELDRFLRSRSGSEAA